MTNVHTGQSITGSNFNVICDIKKNECVCSYKLYVATNCM